MCPVQAWTSIWSMSIMFVLPQLGAIVSATTGHGGGSATQASTQTWAFLGVVLIVSELLLLTAFAVAAIALSAGEAGSTTNIDTQGAGLHGTDSLVNRAGTLFSTLLCVAGYSWIACIKTVPTHGLETGVTVTMLNIFLVMDVQHSILLSGTQCLCGSLHVLVSLHGMHLLGGLALTALYVLS